MNVYFDLLGVQNRDHGERGIARLLAQLAIAIEANDPSLINSYVVHPHLPIPAALEPLVQTGKVRRSDQLDLRPGEPGTYVVGSLMELEEPLATVLPVAVRGSGWRRIAILYDLIPLIYKDDYLQDPLLKTEYLDRVSAYSLFDHLLAISQTTAEDATRYLEYPWNDQTVVYAGVDQRFKPPTPSDSPPNIPGLRDSYVLFPTGIDYRKNVDRTIEAYGSLPASLRAKYQLVLVSRVDPWVRDELLSRGSALGIDAGDLLVPGYVSDQQLVALNQFAELVIFPSLYEGFGLPALEAMRCGAPVICADASSLREVQTLPEARFDPCSVGSIAKALESALTDPVLRSRIRAYEPPDFTWSNAAQLSISAIRQLEPSKAPRRLGVVTPLPPQPSGIAAYAARLLPELARRCDVTVFTSILPEEGQVLLETPDKCRVRPLAELPDLQYGGEPFDEVLYFMGNSRFHLEAASMLNRIPGVVLFHDARFTGLYNEMERTGTGGIVHGSVGRTLQAMYADRYRTEIVEADRIDPDDANRFGILMAADLANAASHRFTHSQYAASLLTLDTGLEVEAIYDLPCPDRKPVEPPAAAPVVASFGIVDPIKQPERIIEAFSKVATAIPAATLRFVGECDPAYRRSLEGLVARLGLAECVHFTGKLDDAGFQQEQAGAAVAVQLREYSNGESSGAVAELLALGIPVVLSNVGSFCELPDQLCIRVTSTAELAESLTGLLTDRRRQAEMSASSRRYAAANSYSNAAQILLTRLGLLSP